MPRVEGVRDPVSSPPFSFTVIITGFRSPALEEKYYKKNKEVRNTTMKSCKMRKHFFNRFAITM
jgi:hypothetical protein